MCGHWVTVVKWLTLQEPFGFSNEKGQVPLNLVLRITQLISWLFLYPYREGFLCADEEYEGTSTFSLKCFLYWSNMLITQHRQPARPVTAYSFSGHKTVQSICYAFIFSEVLRADGFNPFNFIVSCSLIENKPLFLYLVFFFFPSSINEYLFPPAPPSLRASLHSKCVLRQWPGFLL